MHTFITREPGGSPFAEALRQVILDPNMPPHSALSEALLFYAARADHLDNTVRPALNSGLWVICDRFIDSTRVYQGEAGGLPGEIIDVLNHMVVSPTFPDLTIILDIPAELGLGRAHSRRVDKVNPDTEADAYEKRDLAFHWKLRDAFRDIARAEPERCVLIDAARTSAPYSPPCGRRCRRACWRPAADGARARHRRNRGAAARPTGSRAFRIRARPRSSYGHAEAERMLAEALASGRTHHAWLLTGPQGIGKATLAYRFARAALAAAEERDRIRAKSRRRGHDDRQRGR